MIIILTNKSNQKKIIKCIKLKETIDFKNFKPINEGLFCERIFGPVKNWECQCRRYKKIQTKIQNKKKILICPKCNIEITQCKKRNYKLG